MNNPILNKRINNMYNVGEISMHFSTIKQSIENRNKRDNLIMQLFRFVHTGKRYGILEGDIVSLNGTDDTTIGRLYSCIVRATNYYLSNHTYKKKIVFSKESPEVFNSIMEFKKYIDISRPLGSPSIFYMGHIIYVFCIGKYSKWYRHYTKEHARYIDIIRNGGVITNA